MARKKPLQESLIMIVVAGALLSLYVWVLRPYLNTKKESADSAQLLYSGATREKITELSIHRAEEKYFLRKQAEAPNQWKVTNGTKSFDADTAAVDGFFSTLLGAKIEKKLENQPSLEATGLDQAKLRLSVKGDGLAENRELLVGSDTPVDYFTYAKWNDAPEIFLISRSLKFGVDKNFNDWRNRKVVGDLNLDKVSKMEIKVSRLEKHPSTFLSFVSDQGLWKKADSQVRLDPTELKTFLSRVASTQVVTFLSEDPKDKAKFGFNNPIASMVLTPADGKAAPTRYVLSSFTDPKTKVLKYTFFTQDGNESYEVPESTRDHFRVDLMKFRNKKIYVPVASQVYGLKIHSDKGAVKLVKKDSQWQVKRGDDSDEALTPAKGEEVEITLQTLADLQIQEFYDGQTPYALGLQNPLRIVELSTLTDGKEVVVSTLFFGKKIDSPATTVRTEGMAAGAKVDLKVDDVLSIDLAHWAKNPSAPGATASAGSASSQSSSGSQNSLENKSNQGEKKKMKLEPTVKSLSEMKKLPAAIVKKGYKYTAEITMNNGKKIILTFAPDKAPYTVSNFLHLARNGFYNGVGFHRVISRFVAQGGDPTGKGAGGPGWMFDNEDNDLKHLKGSISMAHAGRNTNGSQFFLVLEAQPHLDGVHTVFGSVTQGIDVMEGIKQGDTMKSVDVFEEAL